MQTLDELVGEDAQFDLIKQDVQGAEIMVMNGAQRYSNVPSTWCRK